METLAQYDPSFSHYWAMQTAYNPAAVGKQDKINVNVAYSMALAGFKRNPNTMYASADMPFYMLGSYHGVGLKLVNDAIGLFSHKNLALQYANRQRLFGGTIAVGVQAGVLSESFDGSELEVEQASDPAFSTSEVTGTAVDLAAGVYSQRSWWYAGAAVQHLTAPTVELGETNQLKVDMSYYLMAGGNIRLKNPFLSIQPSVMGRSDGVGYRADATLRLTYTHEQRMMYAGLGYSPSNSVTAYLGGNFHGIMVGYSRSEERRVG